MTLTLESLAARIAALEDIEAIRQLKARYLRGCDLKQPEVVRDTLLPNAVIAYEGFPPFDNRDGFVAVFEAMGCQPGVHDLHHATNSEIALTGPDEATGKWSLNFRSIIMAQRSVIRMGVEYEDRYVRKNGRWWIAETRSTRTGCLIEQVDEAGKATVVVMGDPPAAYGE
ncbi:nuclear transport factor 2 family protein [Novosphingobium sp. B 225]|uniref:nuclear transport factor 2 family protein n=1 Tax=Novosphingobium sp. B 225 TaxID=1961849 RepID=UPI000B4B19B3|nr:nuclear transport factor 2 family protein [Novosphingobium sp. B 225]